MLTINIFRTKQGKKEPVQIEGIFLDNSRIETIAGELIYVFETMPHVRKLPENAAWFNNYIYTFR